MQQRLRVRWDAKVSNQLLHGRAFDKVCTKDAAQMPSCTCLLA